MEAPRISAVIVVHDREALIGRAIESALAARPEELVVVDDGSTDGTWAVIEGFGDRVRGHRQENQGASSARNSGARIATSEWVAFLDSDDLWDEGHLTRAREAIRKTEARAGLYFADTELSPARDRASLWQLSGMEPPGTHELRSDASDWALRGRQPMMLQSSVISREAFEQVGGLSEQLPVREDTELFFRLCLGRSACAVTGVGARMTDDGGPGRLTEQSWTDSPTYWVATRELYGGLLSGGAPLTTAARRELKRRLGAAHLKLARLAPGLPARAFHLTRALLACPSRFFEALGRRLGG